jgi:hypothetical protein
VSPIVAKIIAIGDGGDAALDELGEPEVAGLAGWRAVIVIIEAETVRVEDVTDRLSLFRKASGCDRITMLESKGWMSPAPA